MRDYALLMLCGTLQCAIVQFECFAAQKDETNQILERLKRELPEAHRRLAGGFANVKISGEFRKEYQKKLLYAAAVTYYVKGQNLQCELRFDKKRRPRSAPDGLVFSVSDGAGFELEYAASPSTYLIRQYSAEKDWVRRVEFNAKVRMTRFIYAPFLADFLPVADAVGDSSFVLHTARRMKWRGREAIRVEAKWKPAHWDGFELESAAITFVPSLDWAMTAWELRRTVFANGKRAGTTVSSARVDYGPLTEGEAIYPRSVEYMTKSMQVGDPQEYIQSESLRIESVQPGVVTHEQFSPAAYGLPDYLHPRRVWYQRPLFWIIAVNIALLVLVVWYLLRRRART